MSAKKPEAPSTAHGGWIKQLLSHLDQIPAVVRRRLGLRPVRPRTPRTWRSWFVDLARAGADFMDVATEQCKGLSFTAADLRQDLAQLHDLETARQHVDGLAQDLGAQVAETKARIVERTQALQALITSAELDPRMGHADRAILTKAARPFRAIEQTQKEAVVTTRLRTMQKKAEAEGAVARVAAERDLLALEKKVLRGGDLSVGPARPATAPRGRTRRKARR